MVDSEHRVRAVPHRQRVDSVHPGTQESLRPTAGWRNVPVQVLRQHGESPFVQLHLG